MRNIKSSAVRRLHYFPRTEMLILGALSIMVFQCFRSESHRWLPGMWLECFIFMVIPAIALAILARRLPDDGSATKSRRLINWIQGGAVLTAVLVLLGQWISRQVGLGDANEVVVLLIVLYSAWYLVVFSSFGGFSRAAFVLLSALVLFICFMTTRIDAFVFSFLFALTALWWLLGAYWNRINDKLLDGQSQMLPLNGLAVGSTMAIIAIAGLIMWQIAPKMNASKANGFSFFSGGEEGYQDEFSRGGIGDGDMLTGGPNATTTGAVDSDQYIESHKRSLYDITSEKFNGPVKIKKRMNRAVALQAEAKHMHNVIQSEQSGRSFRTLRESGQRKEMDLEHRITNALFFVEGSVPARFTIDSFQSFDGWDWTKVKLAKDDFKTPPITVRTQWTKPWFAIGRASRSFLTFSRAHRVKVMRLNTSSLPAPSLLYQWHIHGVDMPDMFRWNPQGLVCMDGGTPRPTR